MKILTLTSADFRDGQYVKNSGLLNFDGHVEIAANLGVIRLNKILVKGRLVIKEGTFLETDWSITAGGSIVSDGSIKSGGFIDSGRELTAGGSILAEWYIDSVGSIKVGGTITVGGSINSGGRITAGGSITAGGRITADLAIYSGGSIASGEGISAALSIECRHILKFKYHCFAGICTWEKIDADDKKITCGKIEGGTVLHGTVIETGLEESEKQSPLSGRNIEFELDGQKHIAVIQ